MFGNAGAHAPGALLQRASWTTGAWAPSSRGLFGMSRQLTGPISKWSGLLVRCLSETGRVRAAHGRPSVLAERRRHRRSAAAMACGWRGLQFAGAQDSIAYLYALWQAAGAARRPAHLPLWTTGLRRDCPDHINVILSDLWDTKYLLPCPRLINTHTLRLSPSLARASKSRPGCSSPK